jgi:hypothetical protein
MTNLTLSTPIYNSHQLKQLTLILEDLLGDLNVEAKVLGTQAGRWVQLELLGEDETIATKLLEREAGGFCPVSLENVKKFSALKGYVTGLGKTSTELTLDAGVFEPKAAYVTVPLARLQAHLLDKQAVPLKKLAELWGICENLPLELKILEVDAQNSRLEADLQPAQVRRFLQWRDSLLDRLIVIGASKSEVDVAVAQEGLSRDVIDTEALGMFEHALVCKLGTDAAGLIGRVGRRLRKARFTVFNPKKVLAFLEANPKPTVEYA